MDFKILIVDDDPGILELVVEYLNDEPEEILYAPNGKQAISLAIIERPDLIIMDWEMPILNGIEAVRILQEREETKNIPIIISTGVMMEPQDLKQALESGAVDYMRKPLHPIEFNARIRANLRIKRQHEEILRLLERERELMAEDLARKDRELTTAALNDSRHLELVEGLINDLNELISKSVGEERRAILHMRNNLKSYLNSEQDRSLSFFKHFEEVHPNFFQNLEIEFPQLSINDRRLCAYLKIGLASKEIASLTHVATNSVRKSMSRLKQKLNLTVEEDLRLFISKFS